MHMENIGLALSMRWEYGNGLLIQREVGVIIHINSAVLHVLTLRYSNCWWLIFRRSEPHMQCAWNWGMCISKHSCRPTLFMFGMSQSLFVFTWYLFNQITRFKHENLNVKFDQNREKVRADIRYQVNANQCTSFVPYIITECTFKSSR